jgi:PAS domain S-box-containing protein
MIQKSNLLEKEEYRSIFENATEGIFQSHLTGRFLKVNPAMARIYGYASPQEMVDSITDINKQIYLDKSDRKAFLKEIKKAGTIEGFECRNLRKDKSIIWTSTSAWAVFDESGDVLFIEGLVTDVTNQKMVEEALQESEERFRAIIEHTGNIYYTHTPEHKLTFMSPQTLEILGYEWKSSGTKPMKRLSTGMSI